jgi:hypothetical protein
MLLLRYEVSYYINEEHVCKRITDSDYRKCNVYISGEDVLINQNDPSFHQENCVLPHIYLQLPLYKQYIDDLNSKQNNNDTDLTLFDQKQESHRKYYQIIWTCIGASYAKPFGKNMG